MTRYRLLMMDVLKRPFTPEGVTTDPLHPWNGRDWLVWVETSHHPMRLGYYLGKIGGEMALKAAYAS